MRVFQELKKRWLFLAKTLLFVQTTVILVIVYFFIFVPFALVWKAFHLFSQKRKSYWTAIPREVAVLEDFYEQY